MGVSHACDHPAAKGLPALTRAALQTGDDPSAIDRTVSEALRNGGVLYQVDRDHLDELRPDLVIGQSICDVCALDEAAAQAALPAGARLVVLAAADLAGLRRDVTVVAEALGQPERAEDVLARLDTRLIAIRRALPPRDPLRIAALEWLDPPYVAGHWVPELIAIAGGADVLGQTGRPSRRTSWGEVTSKDPEQVVLMPCGYDLDATAEQWRVACKGGNPLAKVTASADGQVHATAANRLFSRCTPDAVVRGTEVLAGLFHPDVFAEPEPDLALTLS